ncbi:hypothetical protein SPAB_05745 [Salmonella enterica subsp. enterica serovar Paratyphi B str. SPB7]|uniref:Uncharacterized protein n=1 Tax=Salmonella paratyphi B (strain ATCC BAA-1250 / SPB7) TaxID=1016998 RepID=A0A6C6ZA14_SALPB|nr:hypothetical protein SPAB_05745 [Salmonella enterica subsp. enterica serovar Paratyphi B str. SPB7]
MPLKHIANDTFIQRLAGIFRQGGIRQGVFSFQRQKMAFCSGVSTGLVTICWQRCWSAVSHEAGIFVSSLCRDDALL